MIVLYICSKYLLKKHLNINEFIDTHISSMEKCKRYDISLAFLSETEKVKNRIKYTKKRRVVSMKKIEFG